MGQEKKHIKAHTVYMEAPPKKFYQNQLKKQTVLVLML